MRKPKVGRPKGSTKEYYQIFAELERKKIEELKARQAERILVEGKPITLNTKTWAIHGTGTLKELHELLAQLEGVK